MSGYIINPYSFAGAGDSDFSSVKLLVGFEGADASTTFTDESSSARTLTSHNGAEVDTAQFKYGTASGLFDGVNNAISAPAHADFHLPASWCFESWLRFNSTAGDQAIFGTWNSPIDGYLLRFTAGSLDWFCFSGTNFSNAWTPSTATWYHVAITRDGTTTRMFINGIEQATTSAGAQNGVGSVAFTIGSHDNFSSGRPFNGWQDEFRYSRVARYTANFTPPTAAFPRS